MNFEKFINNVDNENKIKENLGIEGIKIKNINRYNDNDTPDINKIILALDKEGGIKEKTSFKFNIKSNNHQPIECYYIPIMKSYRAKDKIISLIDEENINIITQWTKYFKRYRNSIK